MRYQKTNERRAVILMVVLSLLTLFALVGVTFVLYADAEAAAARVAREAETAQRADVDPQQALAFFLGQFIYDVNDTTGVGSGLRGHSLARTMYGSNYVSGVAATGSPTIALTNTLDLSNTTTIFTAGATVTVSLSTNPSQFLITTIATVTPAPPTITLATPWIYSSGVVTIQLPNMTPFSGIGRLHYTYPAAAPTPLAWQGQDDYTLVNYIWFSADGFIRDPERPSSYRASPAAPQTNSYVGGNAPYTYPDLNNFFLAAVKADGTVLSPSFHRKWLFNPLNAFNDMTNLNWTNPQGKYLTLRPRPIDHPTPLPGGGIAYLFPAPDDATGDVKNLVWAPGGNDSIWIDLGAPVMTAPDGTQYKMLFAPLIMDLDGRINLGTAGNILGPGNTHVSNQGWGGWEVNLGKVLYGDSAVTPVEWNNLFRGRTMTAGNIIYGKYGSTFTPSTVGAIATGNSMAHSYSQVDANGLNEGAPGASSSRPAPPGFGGTANYPFPLFVSGYLNGGTELINNPLLYNMFRPPTAYPLPPASIANRVFRASDMEALLRPSMLTNVSPVDANSSALISDLVRLCPLNFGPGANSTRYRNLVTSQSWDIGAPGISPYWWSGIAPVNGYVTANAATAPVNWLYPPYGTAVPFPTLPPTATTATTLPSEFGPDWRASSANTLTYLLSQYVPPLPTASTQVYTSPGSRIRLNRPLPPYPHMGAGLKPAYTPAPTPYGMAYNLTNPAIGNQYLAAQQARQALATDIYRRLLAIAGVSTTFNNPTNPGLVSIPPTATQLQDLANLAVRRWLAQLAVNIVDFIDEDDINTPFNFYTVADGLAAASLGTIQGSDEPGNNTSDYPYGAAGSATPGINATGANPAYWVFGTELPKVVLNEVLAEAQNPSTSSTPAGSESVKVWLELYNTMPKVTATNAQPQDAYRVPLYMNYPAGVPYPGTGYSPYRITIAQSMMNRNYFLNPPTGMAAELPDVSSNPLGKAYIGNANVSNTPPPPTSTTDLDFSALVPLTPGSTTPNQPAYPVPGNTINAGVDANNYFLIGPKSNLGSYLDPFSANLPANIPILRTDTVTYQPTAKSWPASPTNQDERTTGLSILLRRLANPYLPPQLNPAAPYYNPYVTVDYIQDVPIRATSTKTWQSWGKTQPYASLLLAASPTSPVSQQITSSTPPAPPGAIVTAGITNTFGYGNYPLPPSSHYDWLVHLDRPPISPMELLHVSAWPPYMLTRQFMLGNDTTPTITVGASSFIVNTFAHYAPWFDLTPAGQTVATMQCPWWFDSISLPPAQSHRLYRLLEFLECGDRASGVNGLGRIPGKVNINTIWDQEILRALVDANMSIMPPPPPVLPATYDTSVIDPIFGNLLLSRSPNYVKTGTIGPVNMGTGSDDRPFLPLSAGFVTAAPKTQYPNGISIMTDTLLRMNPTNNKLLLFQNPTDTATTAHPYMQTQLLMKLYNNVTTRSNVFAVFLTVGFFQVTNPLTSPPTLGAEIGRSEGRQVRHRMFAIVDRTNLSVFASSSNTGVTGPSAATAPPNYTGQATITLNTTPTATVQAGSQLVIEPGTANEETVVVQTVVGNQITANFTLLHPNALVTGNTSQTYAVIQRGNPGPWLIPYDPRLDPAAVLYFSIID